MFIFKIVYWLGLIAEVIARAPYEKIWRSMPKTVRRISLTEQILLVLLSIAGLVFPFVYTVSPVLNFANYHLPVWLGWLGVVLYAVGVAIFARAHIDLQANWSPSLEIHAGHTLITNGIYHYIRHPMYASQWVMAVAQIFLLQNWLAGPVVLIVFIPFYALRVPAEEQLMLDSFGEPYRAYMRSTASVFPKL